MENKQRGIAYRRHHYARLKHKRVRQSYWGVGTWRTGCHWTEIMLGVAVDTPAPHSDPGHKKPNRQTLRIDVTHSEWR